MSAAARSVVGLQRAREKHDWRRKARRNPSPCYSTSSRSGVAFDFHAVENRRNRLPCRGTFPGVPENDDSPCGGRERRPAPAWTSFPNPAASKAPSTSSSASTSPRQRQQPLNPVGARTLPPPIGFGHWNWQHFSIGNMKRVSGPETRRDPRKPPLSAFPCMVHGRRFAICRAGV